MNVHFVNTWHFSHTLLCWIVFSALCVAAFMVAVLWKCGTVCFKTSITTDNLESCTNTDLFIWLPKPANTQTRWLLFTYFCFIPNICCHWLGQWNTQFEDNQTAVVNRRMIYVRLQLRFASPAASQRLVFCCEAEVLLTVWLEWRGAAAHEKRASVTLSLLGTPPDCWQGVGAGMLQRRGVRWALWWWIIVLPESLPHHSFPPVCPSPHPPPNPITNTVIIRLWSVGHLQ